MEQRIFQLENVILQNIKKFIPPKFLTICVVYTKLTEKKYFYEKFPCHKFWSSCSNHCPETEHNNILSLFHACCIQNANDFSSPLQLQAEQKKTKKLLCKSSSLNTPVECWQQCNLIFVHAIFYTCDILHVCYFHALL